MTTTTMKRLSLLKSYLTKDEKVKFGPPELGIEITNYCNLKCTMCTRTTEMTRPLRNMSLHEFKKIVDDVKEDTEFIWLQDLGEPLLHTDVYHMIEYCKQNGVKVGISTNATMLTKTASERLLHSGIDYIIFAFDGATKETYEKIRVGANYKTVVANIKQFLEMKQAVQSKIFVVLQCIAMNKTLEEVHIFKKMWNIPCVDAVRIRQLTHSGIGQFKNNARGPCYWLWRDPHIKSNGSFVPCCQDTNADLAVGNAKDHNVKELWNSQKMQELRKMHVEGRADEIPACKNCNMYQPILPFAVASFLTDTMTKNKLIPVVETVVSRVRYRGSS